MAIVLYCGSHGKQIDIMFRKLKWIFRVFWNFIWDEGKHESYVICKYEIHKIGNSFKFALATSCNA